MTTLGLANIYASNTSPISGVTLAGIAPRGSILIDLSSTPVVEWVNDGTLESPIWTVFLTGSGDGAVTFLTTIADGADTTQGASTDTAASPTIMGRLLKLIGLLPTSLGQKLAAASLGVVIASDQSAVPVSGTLAAVTAITNPLPAGTNTVGAVKQATQASLTATLAANVTTVTNTTGQSLDGYDGATTIELVAQGTGTQAVSLQIEGSLDNTNWHIVGTAQIDATANPTYTAANFTLTLAGGVTVRHLYALRDTVKYVRITTTANTLATGLSSTLYTNPV